MSGDSVFVRAREKVSIADYLERNNVKLARAGRDQRGPCILCDGGTSKFRLMEGGEKFRCYGCDAHGDVVDLVARHRRAEPFDAARWLLGEDIPMSAPRERRPDVPKGESASDRVAAEILAEAQPFAGTLGERYLLGRGIAPGVAAAAGADLRYHARAKHHWDDQARTWVCAPAMVAPVVVAGPDGAPVRTGGVHVTYLDRATAGKARLEPAKRMWGAQTLDGRPGGAWLHGPRDELVTNTQLVVAEGIETALAFATLLHRKGVVARVCAALSLSRLQGGWLRDADGCFDPRLAEPDPAAPAFVWPRPADDPWPVVWIAIDRDMSEVRVRGRTGRGKPVDIRLTTEVRARVAARLATKAWRKTGEVEGIALDVRSVLPPPGLDFNDELRRVLARERMA
ncbi:MAG: CHC2 zinc finger domain-containing protein [Phenylobacterium sp.]|nr:CHC2 zinc finger domain-containing protein [Phenylobacterium sp.]